jgi:hypothetical protein
MKNKYTWERSTGLGWVVAASSLFEFRAVEGSQLEAGDEASDHDVD